MSDKQPVEIESGGSNSSENYIKYVEIQNLFEMSQINDIIEIFE